MAKSRSRMARFQSPFVITVALGAATACGGTTSDRDCPAEPPAAKASCDYSGPACGYEPCMGENDTYVATCVDGAWSVSEMSCNPPFPRIITTCPDAKPEYGTPCNYVGTSSCMYDDCYGSKSTTATCHEGVWKVSSMSCNPPPPPCPVAPPALGSSCSYVFSAPYCSYPDACGGTLKVHCGGSGNVWTLTEPHSPCGGLDAGPAIDAGLWPEKDGGASVGDAAVDGAAN